MASRRWRAALLAPSTWREIAAFRRALRSAPLRRDHRHAGAVLQIGADRARSRAAAATATTRDSIRERAASLLYDVRHRGRARPARDRAQPRADRRSRSAMRREGAPDYGLDRATLADAAARALRACCCTPPRGRRRNGRRSTGSRSARALRQRGIASLLPWGSEAERARSERIAAGARRRARARRGSRSTQVARLIAGASFVVGVDTGLAASRRGARRAAGRDLRRQRAGPHRSDRARGRSRSSAARAKRRRSPRCMSALERLRCRARARGTHRRPRAQLAAESPRIVIR